MSASTLWRVALVAGLSLACRGKLDGAGRRFGAVPGRLAAGAAPAQTRIRVGEAVTLLAEGGGGRYSFGAQPGGSGGEVRGNRLFAGPTPGQGSALRGRRGLRRQRAPPRWR